MKYKNILVTGGAGFIGSNLCCSLKEKYPQAKIIALDNLKRRGSELNLGRLKAAGIIFIHGDIRCPEDLVLQQKIDLMIECSAEPSVLAGTGDNPAYIINTNLVGTINCLELARKNRADLIFLSTSRVYPYETINQIKTKESATRFEWRQKGIGEDFPLAGPKTLYGATKLASELILQEYCANYGIKAVINRCGVVAGPWQFGKVDQGVFTFWMLAHYFKKNIAYIGYGGKGKQVRDLLHVDDLFCLIDRQIRSMDKLNAQIYNIGGGRKVSLSLLETTKLCQEITGNRINIARQAQNRFGDLKVYLSDCRKAERDFGWQPRKSSEDILIDIFNWIRQNERQLKASFA